jgi:hypothetical protein
MDHTLSFLQVARQTLSDRINGKHKTQSEANVTNQLLNASEEKVLLDWYKPRKKLACLLFQMQPHSQALGAQWIGPEM